MVNSSVKCNEGQSKVKMSVQIQKGLSKVEASVQDKKISKSQRVAKSVKGQQGQSKFSKVSLMVS